MTLRVNVQDGTNAAVKPPFEGDRPDWACPECEHENRGYWSTCPSCGERRPKEDR